MILNKQWNWSSCTKLAQSVSWTHDLVAQSVRGSEHNSVLVGSNPTQSNFLKLLQRIIQWWIPYTHIYTYMYIFIYILYIANFKGGCSLGQTLVKIEHNIEMVEMVNKMIKFVQIWNWPLLARHFPNTTTNN